MISFREKVKNTIERYQMLRPGDTVIVGISGGADSVALLSVLNELKDELHISVIGAHVNHGLRGAEALRDENFSKKLCENLDLEFYVLHENVAQLAKARGLSFETCGRQVRYEFFEKISQEILRKNKGSGVLIATAHNANDVCETILYNITRGSGLKGAAGIPPVRCSEVGNTKIIRPIIDCSRLEILKYLEEKNQSFMTDSTNLDDSYARNRIRIHVLPELSKINENAVSNITRFADSVREDEEYLTDLSKELVINARTEDGYYDVSTLKDAGIPVLKRAIAYIVYEKTGTHAEKVHIDKISAAVKSCDSSLYFKIQLPGGDFLQIKDGFLSVISRGLAENEDKYEKKTFIVEKMSIDECKKSSDNILENALDYGKINGKLFFRNRQSGDKFRPLKRNVNKSLKCLFNEAHIPAQKRAHLNILECDGEIVWIEDFGPADGYQVTDTTKEVLYIHVQ